MNKIVQTCGGLPWTFTDKKFTPWGGLRVLEELLRKIGWEEALEQAPLPEPGSNRGLNPVVMVKGFLVTIWTGGGRFAHTALVRFDTALRSIFGLSQVASVSTFTRFFRRFGQKEVEYVLVTCRVGCGTERRGKLDRRFGFHGIDSLRPAGGQSTRL